MPLPSAGVFSIPWPPLPPLDLDRLRAAGIGVFFRPRQLERLGSLGASEARERCTLKGAGLLSLWMADPYRSTRDVDLLASGPDDAASVRAISGAAWSYGIQETRFEGVLARITSPARTVVDCFRFERLIGREAALEALHGGLRQRNVTPDALYRVMDVLPNRRLRAALETLAP